MPTVNCRRCELPTEGFDASPLPGPRAEEILEHACKACFQDWMGQEIMIINEYRLDLSIPKNQALLDDEMARYLKLPSAPEGEAAGPPPEHVPPPE